jgi:hypothetical protein
MIFSKAGVTDSELKDQETAKFIYDFVEKHGGVENFNAAQLGRDLPPAPPPSSGIISNIRMIILGIRFDQQTCTAYVVPVAGTVR